MPAYQSELTEIDCEYQRCHLLRCYNCILRAYPETYILPVPTSAGRETAVRNFLSLEDVVSILRIQSWVGLRMILMFIWDTSDTRGPTYGQSHRFWCLRLAALLVQLAPLPFVLAGRWYIWYFCRRSSVVTFYRCPGMPRTWSAWFPRRHQIQFSRVALFCNIVSDDWLDFKAIDMSYLQRLACMMMISRQMVSDRCFDHLTIVRQSTTWVRSRAIAKPATATGWLINGKQAVSYDSWLADYPQRSQNLDVDLITRRNRDTRDTSIGADTFTMIRSIMDVQIFPCRAQNI